ncbi:hypothetical protein [Dyella sp. 20L07]|uniref:hypothetical protein n=1 Tax=Dyella sp. 20L07 TaxID=3384240 RepID=UPI003D26D78E
MIRRSLAYGLGLIGFAAAAMPTMGKDVVVSTDTIVPTTFESGHFYAVPELTNGKHLRLMLDTGGGMSPTIWINQSQADDLGIKVDHDCEDDGQTYKAAFPSFKNGNALPDLSSSCRGIVVLPTSAGGGTDGQIVPSYFRGGVWTFDYPGQQVVLRGTAWHPPKDAHSTPLGFKPLPDGTHAGWPRITIDVDGEALSMLLDTGATAKPTAEALKEDPRTTTEGITVGSYIDASTMRRWRDKHPDWQVIEKGDALTTQFTRMIRVPQLEIAGWRVGPVWFIERPDDAFHSMMAFLMDEAPEGAVGGNVLEHFRLTIDYKRKAAWFQCVTACSNARSDSHASNSSS